MTSMSISTTTFAQPSDMTLLRPKLRNAFLETFSSIAYFSWGATIVGKQIDLSWSMLLSTQFDALDVVYAADETVVWDPSIPGSSATYNVKILDLDGKYFLSQESSARFHRRDVQMSLLIMSEVST